ncbi:MAG: galactokinase [Planctomycetes bacterium]|nr:galactokinase [Planctomycetota bacterium]
MDAIDRAEPGLERKAAALRAVCARHLGAGPAPRVFAAPGRVNLMGEHVDYVGGPVLPIAVDRHVLVAARPRADAVLRVASARLGGEERHALAQLPAAARGGWDDYVVGVARAVAARGARVRGVELLVGGDLPTGAGVSSSAALCLATCHALEAAWELALAPAERIEVALAAERDFVGVPCGPLDPSAIELARAGHALWLDSWSGAHEHVPWGLADVEVAVVHSGVERRLAAGAYRRRVEECARVFDALRAEAPHARCLAQVDAEALARAAPRLDATLAQRARHVVSEVARTRAARAALVAGDAAAFGALMTATHASLRDDYEVSCPELDALVAAGLTAPGVFGGRLVGAGFGGCAAFLLATGARAAFAESVRARSVSAPEAWYVRAAGPPREVA